MLGESIAKEHSKVYKSDRLAILANQFILKAQDKGAIHAQPYQHVIASLSPIFSEINKNKIIIIVSLPSPPKTAKARRYLSFPLIFLFVYSSKKVREAYILIKMLQENSPLILIYLNFKGLAQIIRHLLCYLGIDFVDVLLDCVEEQKKILPKIIFDTLKGLKIDKNMLPILVH